MAGFNYVNEALQFPPLHKLISQFFDHIALTLNPISEINFNDYKNQLIARFSNVAIKHSTYQIAMDGYYTQVITLQALK